MWKSRRFEGSSGQSTMPESRLSISPTWGDGDCPSGRGISWQDKHLQHRHAHSAEAGPKHTQLKEAITLKESENKLSACKGEIPSTLQGFCKFGREMPEYSNDRSPKRY